MFFPLARACTLLAGALLACAWRRLVGCAARRLSPVLPVHARHALSLFYGGWRSGVQSTIEFGCAVQPCGDLYGFCWLEDPALVGGAVNQ